LTAVNAKIDELTTSLKEISDNVNSATVVPTPRTKFFYDFEYVKVSNTKVVLGEGQWAHFSGEGGGCNGACGADNVPPGPVSIPPWTGTSIGANDDDAGVYNTPSNEVALFKDSKGKLF
jgi:hypothetical protein